MEALITRRWFIRMLAGLAGFAGLRPALARGQAPAPSPVLGAMKAEMSRSMAALRAQPTPPYFLSYEVTELHSASVSASFGAVTQSDESRRRLVDIDLRVGDYALDQTRPLRGGASPSSFSDRRGPIACPIDDDPEAIRSVLWYHTDQAYRRAAERFVRVKTNVEVKIEQEDRSGDFSREAPARYIEAAVTLGADRRLWERKLRDYTAPFTHAGDVYEATATLTAVAETRWLVSSEGSEIQTSRPYYRLMLGAATRADDGMDLPRYESFFASTPEGLPDDAAVLKTVERILSDLAALRKAPVIQPYTGPAILSGRAAGVFFHEVFGHRIEGHRLKRDEDAQTFKKKLNERVLPPTFSVYFDPTLPRLGGSDLAGFYRFDNEGVPARPVAVLERGIVKAFLMSRTPIEGMPVSNGHGRKQPGFAATARQSNLIVRVAKPVSRAELKRMLLAQVKQEKKPFGLLFEDVQGGFTITGRTFPNAFNVLPILVYRVHPDGREELVRGVDLIGTPLTAFSRIAAGDNQLAVFNGVCGAESGWVPVSAVSPGILISQVEVQKSAKSPDRRPLLPAPPMEPA